MAVSLPNNPRDEEVDMAPMIDMVFLLLVFFMVASHLQSEQNYPIEIPTASYAKIPKDRSDRINITVDKDGKIYLGPTEISKEDLAPIVEQRNKEVENLRIFLRGDAETEHKDVREVMRICAEAGVAEIIFATHDTD